MGSVTEKGERKRCRPLIPGAGIAPEPIARVLFDVEPYIPPSLGTLDGFVYHDDKRLGVTCGHYVSTSKDTELFQVGTNILQPCILGSIFNLATDEDLGYFEKRKHYYGSREAMKRLVTDIEDNPELPVDAVFRQFAGGTFGRTETMDVNVGVAVVELGITQFADRSLPLIGITGIELRSPPLIINMNGEAWNLQQEISGEEMFSPRILNVYGRGAISNAPYNGT